MIDELLEHIVRTTTPDLNLGCPLKAAEDGKYGAYLLGQKDWPLVQDLGRRRLTTQEC